MAIPAAAYVGPDGLPDFKVLDERKRQRMIAQRLCGICGAKMGKELTFLGGDKAIDGRLFMDVANHELCSRYALEACPYLNGAHRQYAATVKPKSDVVVQTLEVVSSKGATRMGLLWTDGYTTKVVNGTLLLYANEPTREVEWHD